MSKFWEERSSCTVDTLNLNTSVLLNIEYLNIAGLNIVDLNISVFGNIVIHKSRRQVFIGVLNVFFNQILIENMFHMQCVLKRA